MTSSEGFSTEACRRYDEDGYLLVKGLFSREEAAALRAEAHALAARMQEHGVRGFAGKGWGAAAKVTDQPSRLLSCHNPQFHSAAFSRLILDPRIIERAASLIGPNVQLHHAKLFIKPPGVGAPFPLHQDRPYFPHAQDSMIAAIIHFDDAPLEKGCVRVVPGSHRAGMQPHIKEGNHHLDVDEHPLHDAVACPAEAGDVLFFSYLTIHGSGSNTSDEDRTTLLLQVRDPADLPLVDTHRSRGQGMMLRGIDPLANASPGVESRSRLPIAPG